MNARRESKLRTLLDSSRNGKFEEKRARLVKQVKQQLICAYDPSGSRRLRPTIEREVQALLKRRNNSKILERDLTALEDKIRQAASEAALRAVTGIPDPPAAQTGTSSATALERGDEALPSRRNSNSNSNGSAQQSLMDREEAKSYHLFLEADLAQLKQEQLAKQRAWRQSQQREKQVLDEQMAEQRERKEREKAEEAALGATMRATVVEYEKAQQLARQQQVEQFKTEKEKRILQQRMFKTKRQALVDKKRKEDQARIEQCVRELEDERQLAMCERLEQQSYAARVQHANEEQRAHRAEMRKKEWEADLQRAEEYAQKLKLEEQQRQDAIERMKAKSNKNQKMYLQATEAKRNQDEADMERALQSQAEHVASENAKAAARTAKVKQNRRDLNEALADQVHTIALRKEAEDQLAEEWAQDARAKAAEAARQAEAETNARYMANMEHRKAIERQIRANRSRPELPMQMNRREQKLNAVEVKHILDKGEVHERVKGRIAREWIVVNSHAKARGRGPSLRGRSDSSASGGGGGDQGNQTRRRNYYGQ